MTERPCDVLISNSAYDGIAGGALEFIEHALALRFRVIAFLLKLSFLCTGKRFERLYPRGHLRRVHVLAERLQDMHDAAHIAAGGEKAAQPGVHAWFVFDRDYCGPATINFVSINVPDARMPWADNGNGYQQRDNGGGYHGPRGTSRAYVLARLQRDGREDLVASVKAGVLSVRGALRQLQTSPRP